MPTSFKESEKGERPRKVSGSRGTKQELRALAEKLLHLQEWMLIKGLFSLI
tara:strand:- start:437 stop:589 length:153 start_codon:yes stop_codon:yes gene_type:complete